MHADPRRILITADAVGGVWQYCVDLATAFANRGIESLVACLGPEPSSEQKQQIASLSHCTLVHRPYALEWMHAADEDVRRSGEWLLELSAQFQPDVVHLSGYAYAALPWQAPVLVTAHSCVASWWRAVHKTEPGDEWSEYMTRVADGLAHASLVVAPTGAMAAALMREHPVDVAKLRVVPNFSSVAVNCEHGKQPLCLAAGRMWDKAKNLPLLDSVAPHIDWPVEVAGSKNSPADDTAQACGLTLLGEISHAELIRRMQAASIFAHPALYEPFGLSVLEAARSHCCLVLSAIPSLQELWHGCAQFADPRDPDQWTFELNRLMRNLAERERLAGLAAERSLQYSEAAAVGGYLTCYRSMPRPQRAKEAAA